MTAITNTIIYIMFLSGESILDADPCSKNIEHLPLDKKIEFSIGCSTVNSHRVFTNYTLEGIYERR